MLIYILLALFLALLIISYFLFKKEIMQPAVIFCTTYVVSVLCATLNIDRWGINLSIQAFLVLLLGAIEFLFVSYIVNVLFDRRKKTEEKNVNEKKEIHVSKIFIIILAIYNTIVLGILLKNVLNIASNFGEYSKFSQALTLFKQHTSYSKDAELPGYLTIMMKPIFASAYIAIFVFFNNVIYSEEKKYKVIVKNSYYLIFPIIYFMQRIIESNRGSILNFCLGTIAIAVIIWSIKNEWKEHISLKIISGMGVAACIGLVIFYYMAAPIGRINNQGLLDYITFYIGGSIECFNQWIQNPDEVKVVRGEYTFGRTIRDLNELGITNFKLKNDNYSKFIYHDGKMVGNIYTSYRSWMHDWGIGGIVILQAILAIVINVLYNVIKYSKNSKKTKDFLIILYGFTIYVIFMHPIDSYFYLEFFTKANVAVLATMTVLYYIAVNIQIDFKSGFRIKYKDKQLEMRKLKWIKG